MKQSRSWRQKVCAKEAWHLLPHGPRLTLPAMNVAAFFTCSFWAFSFRISCSCLCRTLVLLLASSSLPHTVQFVHSYVTPAYLAHYRILGSNFRMMSCSWLFRLSSSSMIHSRLLNVPVACSSSNKAVIAWSTKSLRSP